MGAVFININFLYLSFVSGMWFSMPCNMSHASIPAHIRSERGLPEDLIRLCVGIEDIEDVRIIFLLKETHPNINTFI